MDAAELTADIPLDLARAAHAWTSHVPETRGDQERGDYARALASDYAALAALCDTDEHRARLAEEFARYRAGYRRRFLAYLAARSRCASTMITGGSNFDVSRNRKANDRADKHARAMLEFRSRAIPAMRAAIRPDTGPIKSSDTNAVERLENEIAAAEKQQALMRAVNGAIRKHAKAGADAQVAALGALGVSERVARQMIEPNDWGHVGYAPYQLTNNAANIRRMKARAAQIETAQSTPATETKGERARVEDDPPGNRVRLFFPGKPDEATRARLKSCGFRWAPLQGAWSAYRNDRSLRVAAEVAGTGVAS